MARPALKRCVVDYLVRGHGVSERRACRVVKLHRSNRYYRSRKDPRLELRARIREITQTRVRYGYRRVHVLLKREGWRVGRSQLFRLYQQEQLQLRSKRPRRRKLAVARRERQCARRPNDVWAMDFVADQLVNGKSIRALTIVDVHTREALAIDLGNRLRAENVVAALNRLDAILRAIFTVKDSQNGPILMPSGERSLPTVILEAVGRPELQTPFLLWTLLGYPVWTNPNVASPAANAKTIAFGDFGRYVVRDALDVMLFRMQDSAYTKLGQIGFLAWS